MLQYKLKVDTFTEQHRKIFKNWHECGQLAKKANVIIKRTLWTSNGTVIEVYRIEVLLAVMFAAQVLSWPITVIFCNSIQTAILPLGAERSRVLQLPAIFTWAKVALYMHYNLSFQLVFVNFYIILSKLRISDTGHILGDNHIAIFIWGLFLPT